MSIITLTQANCKNCYKCVRVCPVKSVRVNKGAAEVVPERCIVCGECVIACPQKAKLPVPGTPKVMELLKKGRRLVASVAPSFAAVWGPGSWHRLQDILSCLGFAASHQTAEGARLVAEAFAEGVCSARNEGRPIISTACPVVTDLVRKYYPSLSDFLSPIASPMIAHARMLKDRYGPDTEVVFIGPCLAKKREAEDELAAVLGFDELGAWALEAGLILRHQGLAAAHGVRPEAGSDTVPKPPALDSSQRAAGSGDARLFPLPGAMLSTAGLALDSEFHISVDGLDEVAEVLEELKAGHKGHLVMEALACRGGCGSGPLIRAIGTGPRRRRAIREAVDIPWYPVSAQDTPSKGYDTAAHVEMPPISGSIDISLSYPPDPIIAREPTEDEIRAILAQTGKSDPSAELNCGACGYRSCREKAIAVCQGMAESTMCMPYMESRAESLSNVIIDSTPNAIVVTDTSMGIQEFNPSAEKMFVRRREDVLGKPLSLVIDDADFRQVAETGKPIIGKKVCYSKFGAVTNQTICLVDNHGLVLGLITDTTREEQREKELTKVKAETLDKAQEVIDKQMRVVQEIAGLLGETAAESKLLLTSLMNLVQGEGGDRK